MGDNTVAVSSGPDSAGPTGSLLDDPAEATDKRRPRVRRWVRRAASVTLLGGFAVVAYSYTSALTAAGNDSLSVRSVEWLRNHDMRGLVNRVETRYYSAKQPPVGGLPAHWPTPTSAPTPISASTLAPASSPTTAAAGPTPSALPSPQSSAAAAELPAAVKVFAPNPLPGEGQWQPAGRTDGTANPLYTTFMRPDRVHTSVIVGLAWLNPKLVTFTFVPGLTEPGGPHGSWGAEVPLQQRPSLLATFNSAFKIQDSEGGYYTNGTTVAALKPGIASLVIYADGTANVGIWGRDVSMTPNVVTVRQNLHLLVDNGAPTPASASNSAASWGPTLGNRVFVWRSALGITASGALVYAAGNGMSVQSLAALLAAAHCVRAMELDINPYWTNFYSYTPAPAGDPRLVVPQKLLPDMQRSLYRYLSPDSRDFIAVQLRGGHP